MPCETYYSHRFSEDSKQLIITEKTDYEENSCFGYGDRISFWVKELPPITIDDVIRAKLDNAENSNLYESILNNETFVCTHKEYHSLESIIDEEKRKQYWENERQKKIQRAVQQASKLIKRSDPRWGKRHALNDW